MILLTWIRIHITEFKQKIQNKNRYINKILIFCTEAGSSFSWIVRPTRAPPSRGRGAITWPPISVELSQGKLGSLSVSLSPLSLWNTHTHNVSTAFEGKGFSLSPLSLVECLFMFTLISYSEYMKIRCYTIWPRPLPSLPSLSLSLTHILFVYVDLSLSLTHTHTLLLKRPTRVQRCWTRKSCVLSVSV